MSRSENNSCKPGDVVWTRYGKTDWPCRIANESEVGKQVLKAKKGNDYLIWFFGDEKYGWVKCTQLSHWKGENHDKCLKNNRAKSFPAGLSQAEEWIRTEPKVFPLCVEINKDSSNENGSEDRSGNKNEKSPNNKGHKRKRDSVESDRSPNKKAKSKNEAKIVQTEDETLDLDSIMKIRYGTSNFNEIKEKRREHRVKIMRQLGLYPPEHSPFENLLSRSRK